MKKTLYFYFLSITILLASCGEDDESDGSGSVAVVSVALSPDISSIPIGLAQQYTATATFSDGSTSVMTCSCIYKEEYSL